MTKPLTPHITGSLTGASVRHFECGHRTMGISAYGHQMLMVNVLELNAYQARAF